MQPDTPNVTNDQWTQVLLGEVMAVSDVFAEDHAPDKVRPLKVRPLLL